MLTKYVQAAMRHAHYEMIDDPDPFYGSIPECQGVSWQLALPQIDGLGLSIREVV